MPALSVNTVLVRVPLRELPWLRPSTACLSYPRCSLISSANAVSITCFVIDLSSPSGPVRSSPRARAAFTNSRIAARSACSGVCFVLRAACSNGLIPARISVTVTNLPHRTPVRRVEPVTPEVGQSRCGSRNSSASVRISGSWGGMGGFVWIRRDRRVRRVRQVRFGVDVVGGFGGFGSRTAATAWWRD